VNKDQEFMKLVKSVLLDDDLRLLKAFPMFVDYKRDIVYTPEIVDYFIDNLYLDWIIIDFIYLW
jgi:hypothetical protein